MDQACATVFGPGGWESGARTKGPQVLEGAGGLEGSRGRGWGGGHSFQHPSCQCKVGRELTKSRVQMSLEFHMKLDGRTSDQPCVLG